MLKVQNKNVKNGEKNRTRVVHSPLSVTLALNFETASFVSPFESEVWSRPTQVEPDFFLLRVYVHVKQQEEL